MKRLAIERFYLNRADDEYPMTVRLSLQMKDAVDGPMLQEATAATQARYPYLCVRLGITRDADGSEHFVYHDNPRPWKVSNRQPPVCLCSEAANEHLLAFSWWDHSIVLDFFHALIDGTAAYRLLRTLLYEYCRRRYDSNLSPEGVWVAGDVIDEDEWTDPAMLPRPASITPQPFTSRPPVINLATDAIAPLAEKKEVVQIIVDEELMMKRVKACGATPTSFLSLLLLRSIARLHPHSAPSAPTVTVAVDLRKPLGTIAAHHSQVGGLFIPLGPEMQGESIEKQVADFRRMVTEQTYPDNLQDYFWQTQDRMERIEQLPTLTARHQAFAPTNKLSQQYGSCMFSYVGKACLGAAEQYVSQMRTETDSAYMIVVEVSAAGGSFCISFMQQFATDVYLDAFFDELSQQGLTYEIADRHKLQIAPIADYRNDKRFLYIDSEKQE